MNARRYATAALLAVSLSACSAVRGSFVKPGYDAKGADAIKRIAIAGWAEPGHAGLDALLAAIATDRINLKMNYLVYHSGVLARGWSDLCSVEREGEETPRALEGVLSIRALGVAIGESVKLHLVAELHGCADGALLWRADGREGNAAADENLTALTESYIANLGAGIEPYAAPAFLVMRDMLETLPDPLLNDDEVMEKIELSRAPAPHPSQVCMR